MRCQEFSGRTSRSGVWPQLGRLHFPPSAAKGDKARGKLQSIVPRLYACAPEPVDESRCPRPGSNTPDLCGCKAHTVDDRHTVREDKVSCLTLCKRYSDKTDPHLALLASNTCCLDRGTIARPFAPDNLRFVCIRAILVESWTRGIPDSSALPRRHSSCGYALCILYS